MRHMPGDRTIIIRAVGDGDDGASAEVKLLRAEDPDEAARLKMQWAASHLFRTAFGRPPVEVEVVSLPYNASIDGAA